MSKKNLVNLIVSLLLFSCCSKETLEFSHNDIKIAVFTGQHWLHDFPLFAGISKKNPPQAAIWVTDIDTNYLATIYCTHKLAHKAWVANKGNRRKETLPFWCHNRGVKYSDGLLLPTKEQPLIDACTGATPKSDFFVKLTPHTHCSQFILFAEFNHSIDYNWAYQEDTPQNNPYYSGGKGGSGQPAVVFSKFIDLNSPQKQWTMELIGYASPDGSTGLLYPIDNTLTTALHIVERITIEHK